MSQAENGRKAWQEPMVWLMAGIPLATIVAGIATLVIALRSGPLDGVPASVQRVSQIQTLDSAADLAATRLDYHGYLLVERGASGWRLELKTAPPALAEAPAQVLFVHPYSARQDVRVALAAGRAVLAQAPAFVPSQVVVTDDAGSWRLVGDYSDSGTLTLTPAVQAR